MEPSRSCFLADEPFIHIPFEKQVAKTPDAIAAIAEEDGCTYQDLDVCSSGHAIRLPQLGMGPDKIAGWFINRYIDMLCGGLATFKAAMICLTADDSINTAQTCVCLER